MYNHIACNSMTPLCCLLDTSISFTVINRWLGSIDYTCFSPSHAYLPQNPDILPAFRRNFYTVCHTRNNSDIPHANTAKCVPSVPRACQKLSANCHCQGEGKKNRGARVRQQPRMGRKLSYAHIQTQELRSILDP